MTFRSPNEVKADAERLMLNGREAQSHRDWQLVVNCWAANFPKDLAEVECLVCAKIFDCPLAEDEIKQIVAFQLERRP